MKLRPRVSLQTSESNLQILEITLLYFTSSPSVNFSILKIKSIKNPTDKVTRLITDSNAIE